MMFTDPLTWLDPTDLSVAMFRHQLADAAETASPVFTLIQEDERAVLGIFENISDASAPLVMFWTSQPRLVTPLLNKALRSGQRYLFIVPERYWPELSEHLRYFEYLDRCLLHTCEQLHYEGSRRDLVRYELADGCYGYAVEQRGLRISYAELNWQLDNVAEIGVWTRKEHRGKGYAKNVVAALTRDLLAAGKQPLYVASEKNLASRAVCRRLGYRWTGDVEIETVARFFPAPEGRASQS